MNFGIHQIHVMDLTFVYPKSYKDYLIKTIKVLAYCILHGIEYGKLPIEFISKNNKHFWNHKRNILYSKLQPTDELYV